VIQKKSSHMIRYDFPDNLSSPIRTKYRGQEQWWFHLHFLSNAQADLSKSEGEFRNLDWWSASEILNHIIDWKRQAYEDGFRALNFLGD
jgi:hypothetical protein